MDLKLTKISYGYLASFNDCTIGEIVLNDDGYYVLFFDHVPSNGYWEAVPLRQLANKLDELNREWDKQVQEELGTAIKNEVLNDSNA